MTKKEIVELRAKLEQFLPELRVEIDNAKNDLKNARTLKTQLETIINSSDALLKKLQDPTEGVDAILTKSVDSLTNIAANSESAQISLNDIQTALTTATQHVDDMETAYANFNAIKKKIDDPETGLDVTLANIKQVRARAKESATKTSSILATADITLVKLQKYITSIDKVYENFLDSKKKVEDPTDGLEAILGAMKKLRDKISAVADQSNTLFTQISGYKDEAVNSLKDISKNKTDSEITLANIRQHESDSETAKKSIENLLNIASQESSTAYFKKRTRFVIIAAIAWLTIGIASLAVAIILGHQLVNDILEKDSIELSTVMARTLVVTPVIAFAFYAFRNYGKERGIAEQYAFREISGATIEGHVEMTHRAFPDSESINEKLEDAVVNVIKNLHSEPSELQRASKSSLKVRSKLADLEAEMTDIRDDLIDIKDPTAKTV